MYACIGWSPGLFISPYWTWLGCHARWGSFFWPSPFWPPIRSSKAPPKKKKIWGMFYPTPATPSRTWPPSHARWGDLYRSMIPSPATTMHLMWPLETSVRWHGKFSKCHLGFNILLTNGSTPQGTFKNVGFHCQNQLCAKCRVVLNHQIWTRSHMSSSWF